MIPEVTVRIEEWGIPFGWFLLVSPTQNLLRLSWTLSALSGVLSCFTSCIFSIQCTG